MTQSKRVFIAIELDRMVKQQLVLRAKAVSCGVLRLVPSSNLHITLCFLGDLELERVRELEKGLPEAVSSVQSFPISICGLGCFPNCKCPRVLWWGIESEKIMSLHLTLSRWLHSLSLNIDNKKFIPHITWARLQNGEILDAQKEICDIIEWKAIRTKVRAVTLFESIMHRGRAPVYRRLAVTNIGVD